MKEVHRLVPSAVQIRLPLPEGNVDLRKEDDVGAMIRKIPNHSGGGCPSYHRTPRVISRGERIVFVTVVQNPDGSEVNDMDRSPP